MDRSLQRRLQKTNYQHIKRLCRDRGQLFEDPDFPPNNRSIYRNKKPPLHPIVWLRPHVSLTFSTREAFVLIFFEEKIVVQLVMISSKTMIRFPCAQYLPFVVRQGTDPIFMRKKKS